jgi:hypothetical protein
MRGVEICPEPPQASQIQVAFCQFNLEDSPLGLAKTETCLVLKAGVF